MEVGKNHIERREEVSEVLVILYFFSFVIATV